MRKNNPACYECSKGKDTLHTWKRLTNREAICVKCGTVLSEQDADEVFEMTERRTLVCGCVLGFERCINCRPGLHSDQLAALAITQQHCQK